MRTESKHHFDVVSGLTALFSVVFWLASAAVGLGLRKCFPDFDGIPLLLLLLTALAVACAANRIAAKVFARSHFGMPAEERQALYARHDEDCRKDPDAVLARFRGMETVPIFLLVLYFVLVFAIGVASILCLSPQDEALYPTAMGTLGSLLTAFLGFMPILRLCQQRYNPLDKTVLVPVGSLPLLEATVKKAADAAGIRGTVRLQLTREDDCSVNRIGHTYVVFLGTRFLYAATEEELYAAMLMHFSEFPRPQEHRQILRRYYLAMLSGARIRPLTFAFDLYFSSADAYMEWEYSFYTIALRWQENRRALRFVQQNGDPRTAATALCKEAAWRYFVFEANDYVVAPYYAPADPAWHYEQDVCDSFRRALSERSSAWYGMLRRELPHPEESHPLFRDHLDGLGIAGDEFSPKMTFSDPHTPYGQEVASAIAQVDEDIRRSQAQSYRAERKREYLEPLQVVEAYEANPTGYATSELSPVLNAYRDLGRIRDGEALCDSILETERNPFALAHATYFKGMCMLRRYETEGIDFIYRAIDTNKNYMKDGFELVAEYCTLCGLSDEYETLQKRAAIQVSAHAYNHESAGSLSPRDHLVKEEGLGDMLPDILNYMVQTANGCIGQIYLVRKVISEDFFSSVFVINFAYGASRDDMRRTYEAIFNYLDSYPVDWQFSLFVYDRETEQAVRRVEGSLVWEQKDD